MRKELSKVMWLAQNHTASTLVGSISELSSYCQSCPLPQRYSIYSKQARPDLRYFISEVHVPVIRHLHKAQNSPNFNNVYIQLPLNRISIHSVSFLQTYGRNKCKKHMLSPNPFSFPPGTCFCPHKHQTL